MVTINVNSRTVSGSVGDRQARWDKRYLLLAKHVSGWSKDPSTKIGAVIVSPHNTIVSVGYNGLAAGVADYTDRLEDREYKYANIIHGEMNAILHAPAGVHKCTLYTWPFMCCSRCAAMIVQAGISRHVAPISYNTRWKESFEMATNTLTEAGVELYLETDI